MKLGVLFSGGKDSTYSAYLEQKKGHELACLISIFSKNKESFMFHTPSIEKVKKQAEVMDIPLLIQETEGEKEKELVDLEKAILNAKKKYKIEGIVTGALASNYQASRIQNICNNLGLECFNPLWGKEQILELKELINNNFEIIIIGVFAYPLNEKWLGKKIDNDFIEKVAKLQKDYGINPAGEGGEFESFVLYCPLFKRKLVVTDKKISGGGNSWKMEIEVD